MDRFLKQYELIPSDVDSCVYRNKGELHTLLGIYVDDGIIASLYLEHITSIITYLEMNFKVIQGGMEYFVGFQINRDPFTGSIFIHQTRYIDDIVDHFGMKDANLVSTLVDTHARLSNQVDPTNPPIHVPYKEVVGFIIYTTLFTRPDISYAASLVAKFQPKPKQSHWTITKRIYRYLKGTMTYGIKFARLNNPLKLFGYSDVDFGGDLDDRRSRTGYVYTLGGAAITWDSHRQGAFVDSTTRAELIACAESVNKTDWLVRLLLDIGITQILPITIFSYNQVVISLIKNPDYQNKH
jgi:hypothetical protein